MVWLVPGHLERMGIMQVYLTGHGGEDFLKFNDKEELTSRELGRAFAAMQARRNCSHVLLIVDTCQATTLFTQLQQTNLLAVASSIKGDRIVLGTASSLPQPSKL